MIEIKEEPKVVHATCVVERSFPSLPKAVFQALSEPEKIRKWMGPSGNSELLDFRSDFREGGFQIVRYRMGPETPIAGVVITNEACFQSIAQDERIVMSSTMKRDNQIFSASLITFELLAAGEGTDLIITHQGAFFEGADGPAMRNRGWESLADRLAAVVTADEPTGK